MLRAIVITAALTAASVVQPAPPRAERAPGSWRQYESAAAAGFDADGLAAARAYAERLGTDAAFLVVRGRVVAAWGDPARRFKTYSVRKSLLDLMFGAPSLASPIALHATMADLGIDDRQGLTVRERAATIDHLLSSRSGVYHPAAREPESMTRSRPQRGSADPGATWFYNNWDFNVLGSVYERVANVNLFDGFRRTLAEPLELEDFRARDGYAVREPSKSQHAAYEFVLSARDLARVGQLVLQNGRWGDRVAVRPDWLAESFRPRTPFPQGGGYGYLWWIDAGHFRAGRALPALDAVRSVAATGNGEQLLLVIPSLDLVFVHLTSRDEEQKANGLSSFALADLILQARRGAPRSDAAIRPLSAEPLPNAPALVPEHEEQPLSGAAADYIGAYQVSPAVQASVHHTTGGLFVVMPGRGEAEMFQEAPDRFFLKVADVVLAFERDPATRAVIGVTVTERGRTLAARKVG